MIRSFSMIKKLIPNNYTNVSTYLMIIVLLTNLKTLTDMTTATVVSKKLAQILPYHLKILESQKLLTSISIRYR